MAIQSYVINCEWCSLQFIPRYRTEKFCSHTCRSSKQSSVKKKIEEVRICLLNSCKKEYNVPHNKKDKKFCSKVCYFKSKDQRVTITCKNCQKPFTVDYRFRKQTHCNRKCFFEVERVKKRITHTCLWCDEEFETIPFRTDAKFCCASHNHLFIRNGAEKIVTLTCENKNCDKENKQYQARYIHRFKRFCTQKCANSGENNGMYGRTGPLSGWYGKHAWSYGLTSETDERVRLMGEKVAEVISEQFSSGARSHAGENNPMHGRTRDTMTPENLENYSRAAIERLKNGGGFVKGIYESYKTGKNMPYRSSWELRLMKVLDRDGNVEWYEYEDVTLYYNDDNGVQHRYLPDFIVKYSDGDERMIEVKPEAMLEDRTVILKEIAAKEYCKENNLTYEFFTLSEIESHEERLGLS